jgi:hypothetical protein
MIYFVEVWQPLLEKKTALEWQGVVELKKVFNIHTLIVGYVLHILLYEIFSNVHGLARRGFPV